MEAIEREQAAPSQHARSETLGGLVESIAVVDRTMSSLAARRAELVDQAREWSELGTGNAASTIAGWDARAIVRRELVTELATALRIPERTAENLVAESRSLAHQLSAAREALSRGEISYRHAQAMVEHAASLPDEAASTFEQAALPCAMQLTVAKFDRKARVLRERAHPESISARRVICQANRSVEFQPARDGMAWLNLYLPAEQALAAYNRVTDIAKSLQVPSELRTLAQLRADALAHLLINGHTPESAGIRASVHVTVPVMTVLGADNEPGSLEGYGPIDADTARRLAAHAPSFVRLLTHPESGVVLSVGRTRYAVPHDLRTWLRVRDETCRFPGCSRAARLCDIDHTHDWQFGGSTRHDNLAHLCRSHHNVKHHTTWQARQRDGGVIEWTSPAGNRHTTEPATGLHAGP